MFTSFYEQVRVKIACRCLDKIPSEMLFELEKKLYLVSIIVEGAEKSVVTKGGDDDDGKGGDDEDNSDDNYDDLDDEQDQMEIDKKYDPETKIPPASIQPGGDFSTGLLGGWMVV
jgi:hypothetical protein